MKAEVGTHPKTLPITRGKGWQIRIVFGITTIRIASVGISLASRRAEIEAHDMTANIQNPLKQKVNFVKFLFEISQNKPWKTTRKWNI